VYVFEGDFLKLKPAAAVDLPLTPLVAPMKTAKGSRFFHRLELLGKAAVLLKAKNLHTQWVFLVCQSHPRLQLGHIRAAGIP
jgi:hypothetical protein